MKTTICRVLFLVAISFFCQNVSAEVTTIEFPAAYEDFAFSPETGDLVAISAEKNHADIFTLADLAAGKTEPKATIRVGSSPSSVAYKKYQDKEYFAVVCLQDSYMFLIDAKAPYDLVSKIELTKSGVTLVRGSINPDDPYLYYSHPGTHYYDASAVDLRDMRNKGVAFDKGNDFAISASGEIAYRRSTNSSPTGFESVIRASSLSDPVPKFDRLFYDHNSTNNYLPDPFNLFIASGVGVYSKTLEKKEASLPFIALLFFESKPLLFGIDASELSYSYNRPRDGKSKVKLQVASYNTFSPIGESVTLTHTFPEESDDSRNTRFRARKISQRLFADEKNDRVIYAESNTLHLVPLGDFNLPDEPFLLAELKGADSLRFGQENKLKLTPKDKRVMIEIVDKPEGMEVNGESLTWTPAPDQIGSEAILVTVKAGDLQRSLKFDLNVEYPRTNLPFAASGIAVDEPGQRAIVWGGTPLMNNPGFSRTQTTASPELAVLNLATGEIAASRQVAEPIQEVLIANKSLVVRAAGSNATRCDILNVNDLERTKTLASDGPITELKVEEGLLFLQSNQSVQAFDLENFDRKFNLQASDVGTISMTEYGIYAGGILFGYDLKTKMILNPGLTTNLGGDVHNDPPSYLRRSNDPRQNNRNGMFRPGGSQEISLDIPGTYQTIKMNVNNERLQVPGATHTWRTRYEIALTAGGTTDTRQVIVSEVEHSQTSSGSSFGGTMPLLTVTPGNAYVVRENYLYRWPLPKYESEEVPSYLSKIVRWDREQSALALSSDKTTVLKHNLVNGKQPLVYTMPLPIEGVTIDEKTGEVTIDNSQILAQAADLLERRYLSQARGGKSAAAALREEAPKLIERATLLLGRRPTGVPAAMPVQLSASDANLATKNLTYYVIVEVPSKEFMERLNVADAKRAEEMAAAPPMPMAAEANGPQEEGDRIAELTRKIEVMEQQIQMLTRQMNLMMQKLEKVK